MSARLLALVCLECGLTALPALAAENLESSHTTIAVYLNSGSNRGPELAVMKREAEALLEGAGFRIDWRSLSGSASSQTAELAVVDLRGSCTADPSPSHAPLPDGDVVLASTAVIDGRVEPFSDLDCNAVGRLLAPALSRTPAGFRSYLYGRAMGRILAHDLYHVIVKTRDHDAAGVAKPCFSIADLLGSSFEFETITLARLHTDAAVSAEDTSGR